MACHVLPFPVAPSAPQPLTEKYKPLVVSDFCGLQKPKAILSKLARNPFASAWMLTGPSGLGKTTMAEALAREIHGEVHHLPSGKCTLEEVDRIRRRCQYVPALGFAWHVVLVDEADMMSQAAQNAFLSLLDGTNPPPQTIFLFTANDTARLEARFLSRTRVLEFSSYGMAPEIAALLARVWTAEVPADAPVPNFARITKDAANNARGALMALEIELMSV